jgi:hypothetical protein
VVAVLVSLALREGSRVREIGRNRYSVSWHFGNTQYFSLIHLALQQENSK